MWQGSMRADSRGHFAATFPVIRHQRKVRCFSWLSSQPVLASGARNGTQRTTQVSVADARLNRADRTSVGNREVSERGDSFEPIWLRSFSDGIPRRLRPVTSHQAVRPSRTSICSLA